MDSEEERISDEKYAEELAKKLPQGTDKTPEVLKGAVKGLPDKLVENKFSKFSNKIIYLMHLI